MKEIINKTARHLSMDEFQAVLQCAKILEEAFKRKMYTATINATAQNNEDVYGIAFAFDMYVEGYK